MSDDEKPEPRFSKAFEALARFLEREKGGQKEDGGAK